MSSSRTDDLSVDDDSSPSPEEEDEDEDEEEHDMDSSLRPTSFCLNGKLWSFENPVSLVLAAARQLGMAVQRDARLLWIADEALLDEFDEEQAAARWLGSGPASGSGSGSGSRGLGSVACEGHGAPPCPRQRPCASSPRVR